MLDVSSLQIAQILELNQQPAMVHIRRISTDSRAVDGQTLFIALKGEKFDGHDFIVKALNDGVPLVLAEHIVEGADPAKVLLVEDTLKAYGKLAQFYRRQFHGTVIALTGSSGKTTTKEELKAALSCYGKTCATSGNFNNFIGVPKSLLSIELDAKFAIIEMGMSARHEIEYLTQLVKPDVALVTNVYPMHLEFLKTIDNIALAKAEIFGGLKENGIAIYNEDSAKADVLAAAAQKATARVIPFGEKHHPEVALKLAEEGNHYRYNAWAVLSVIKALGLELEPAVAVVNHFTAPEGRGKKFALNVNGKKVTLLDNSYSGGPDATVLAVETLAKTNGRRKVAVIGKMAELGDYTVAAHQRVGQALGANHIDVVIGVCAETKDMLAQLPAGVEQHYFDNIHGVADFLCDKLLQDGDVLLMKGSHYSSEVYKAADVLKTYAV